MTIEPCRLEVGGISVEIHRKAIKNLHIGVYPPHGKVRIATPLHLDDEAVRLAVVSRLRWIRRKQKEFASQSRQSARELVTGESHYFQGQRYRLNVVHQPGTPRVRVVNRSYLELKVPPWMNATDRQGVLDRWYRRQIKAQIPELLEQWEKVIGVRVTDCRIKRMKTRWGSCNTGAGRVWLNLELAKKPFHCLEYILVHELVHLLERRHSERFRALMDSFLPDWRLRKDDLNRLPLAHDDWDY